MTFSNLLKRRKSGAFFRQKKTRLPAARYLTRPVRCLGAALSALIITFSLLINVTGANAQLPESAIPQKKSQFSKKHSKGSGYKRNVFHRTSALSLKKTVHSGEKTARRIHEKPSLTGCPPSAIMALPIPRLYYYSPPSKARASNAVPKPKGVCRRDSIGIQYLKKLKDADPPKKSKKVKKDWHQKD